jgi:hypothetical protein
VRRALDSAQVGHGPQTAVYLPSELSESRVTWHRWGVAIAESGSLKTEPIAETGALKTEPSAETGPLEAEPLAGADGPEFPYPSTVTGAVPAGAPVTVSWAAAGVADTTAQTAAADRNVKTKRFI